MSSGRYQAEIADLTSYFAARLPACGPLILTAEQRSQGCDALTGLHSDLVRGSFVEWLAIHQYELSYNQTCVAFFQALDAIKTEPDMTRMGDKHIKLCRGCDALILWAKHVNTNKAAPLVKAKADEKPNCAAWYVEESDQWFYEITKPDMTHDTRPPEYVNHFSNCARSKDFRAAPVSEDESRQAQIK